MLEARTGGVRESWCPRRSHVGGAVVATLAIMMACGGSDGGSASSAPPVAVASVIVTPSSVALPVGATMTIVATARSASGVALTGRTAVWSTSNANVATVAGGVVTGVATGSTQITVNIEGVSAAATATVVTARNGDLQIVSGDQQRGLVGRALADSLVVRAINVIGDPTPGVSVTWQATAGTLSSTTSTTDAAGRASVQWLAGSGDMTAAATSQGGTVTFRANGRSSGTCTLDPQGQRLTLGPTDFTLSLRATQPHRVVALFADFSDAPATETQASFISSVVDPGLAVLKELSYGRVSITVTATTKWYRMSQPSASYTWATFTGHKAFLTELTQLATGDVDFSLYDAIFVFEPRGAAQANSPTFNGGQSNGVTAGGKVFGNAVTFGQDARTWGPTILAHETGHMLGLVDLYSFDPSAGSPYTGNQFRDVGAWSIMSNVFTAGHTFAWEKRKLGFIDDAQVDCLDGSPGGVEEVITPVEVAGGFKMIAVPLDQSRALAVEVRSNQGMDAALCAQGVLIYQVNAAALSGYDPAIVRGSRASTSGAAYSKCGPWADGTYGVAPGDVSTFTDAGGARVDVLAKLADGSYRVRVRRP